MKYGIKKDKLIIIGMVDTVEIVHGGDAGEGLIQRAGGGVRVVWKTVGEPGIVLPGARLAVEREGNQGAFSPGFSTPQRRAVLRGSDGTGAMPAPFTPTSPAFPEALQPSPGRCRRPEDATRPSGSSG